MAGLPRVLLVASAAVAQEIEGGVRAAMDGGVRFVQLRVAHDDDEEVRSTLQRLRRVAPPETIWAVNGRPELARSEGVGLHLPAAHGDGERAGAPRGRSAHDPLEVRRALAEEVDYVVLGTVFPTPSKPGRPTLGVEGLRDLVRAAGGTPAYAIGGIDPGRAARVLETGCHGVAVFSSILGARDPESAARALVEEVRRSCGDAGGVH